MTNIFPPDKIRCEKLVNPSRRGVRERILYVGGEKNLERSNFMGNNVYEMAKLEKELPPERVR